MVRTEHPPTLNPYFQEFPQTNPAHHQNPICCDSIFSPCAMFCRRTVEKVAIDCQQLNSQQQRCRSGRPGQVSESDQSGCSLTSDSALLPNVRREPSTFVSNILPLFDFWLPLMFAQKTQKNPPKTQEICMTLISGACQHILR